MTNNAVIMLRELTKLIWVRATAFSVAAVVTALLAAYVGPYVPYDPSLSLASGSVDDILTILATSMLTVTTFSLSTMVSAYSSATAHVTPRAIRLLREDPVAQNTLATFLGSFLFSIVGIIGLSAGVYDGKGRVILFVATLLVLVIIAVMLLRWIEQLGRLGRVSDTIHRIERAASPVARKWGNQPRLGAKSSIMIPTGARAVSAKSAGYVTNVDSEQLEEIAQRHGLVIHIAILPGAFVYPARPIAHVIPTIHDDVASEISNCFIIEAERSFDHDPDFGLVVLSEVASRALSPAVNDPGTAIEVIGAGIRVLFCYSSGYQDATSAVHSRLHAPDLSIRNLFDDFFNPIARDGATMIEVQIRLQAALEALALTDPLLFGDVSRILANSAVERAEAGLYAEDDLERLRQAAEWMDT